MEKQTINLPDNGTRYWYVSVMMDFKTFTPKEAFWNDTLRNRRHYASGNFFTTYKEAYDIALAYNEIMGRMSPQAKQQQ